MLGDVTRSEIEETITITNWKHRETAWNRKIYFTYEDKDYEMQLMWNSDDGYSWLWTDVSEYQDIPRFIYNMMNRPEFEYVMDGLTIEQNKPQEPSDTIGGGIDES